MKHLLIILITFAISSMVNAQMLTLISESKQKTFPSLHELTVYAANNQSKKDYFTYNGQFVTATKDSITLRLKSMSHNLKDKNDKTIMHDHHYKNSPDLPEFMTIAKVDIYEIENYKSGKKANGRSFRGTLGGILFGTGVLTFATSYIAKNKTDRNAIQLLSGIECGLGIILGMTSKTQDFDTWNEWQIKN